MSTHGDGERGATRATISELIDWFQGEHRRLDTTWSREFLDQNELALCVDDLVFELNKTPPTPCEMITRLSEVARAVGAAEATLASLATLLVRPSVLTTHPSTSFKEGPQYEAYALRVDGRDLGTYYPAPPVASCATLAELRGERPGQLPDGSALLWVCEWCGSFECGTQTVRVELVGDAVYWHDFETHDHNGAPLLLAPLWFERAPYLAALASLPERPEGTRWR